MEKNEIVINGVHHVLVADEDKAALYYDCGNCSILMGCGGSLICERLFKVENSHFEIKEEKQ